MEPLPFTSNKSKASLNSAIWLGSNVDISLWLSSSDAFEVRDDLDDFLDLGTKKEPQSKDPN